MEKTLVVAKFLNDLFKNENGTDVYQMKMHKLMYFAQRESLMYNKEPLFDSEFEGWKYGPVLVEVRDAYKNNDEVLFSSALGKVSEDTENLLRSVYKRYGKVSSWNLSGLSHAELSWKSARKGLKANENGSNKLVLGCMRLDAERELRWRRQVESGLRKEGDLN